MQKRRNFIATTLELRLFYTKPSFCNPCRVLCCPGEHLTLDPRLELEHGLRQRPSAVIHPVPRWPCGTPPTHHLLPLWALHRACGQGREKRHDEGRHRHPRPVIWHHWQEQTASLYADPSQPFQVRVPGTLIQPGTVLPKDWVEESVSVSHFSPDFCQPIWRHRRRGWKHNSAARCLQSHPSLLSKSQYRICVLPHSSSVCPGWDWNREPWGLLQRSLV